MELAHLGAWSFIIGSLKSMPLRSASLKSFQLNHPRGKQCKTRVQIVCIYKTLSHLGLILRWEFVKVVS